MLGINTARALTFKNGRINEEQMRAIHQRFDPLPEHLTKIVVTHHPFDLPDQPDNDELVGRAAQAMKVFAECGVDLLLAGHFHATQSGDTSGRHELPGYSALVVQAGTATSTRGRGESNSFNVVRVEPSAIAVETWAWQPERARSRPPRWTASRRTVPRWIERWAGGRSAGAFLVLQQAPHRLARPGFRQRVDELHDLRHLVGGHVLARPGDDVLGAVLPFAASRSTTTALTVSPR